MVMRGRYPAGHAEPFVVHRFARGGGQGCPDMQAAFAGVIAMTDLEAEAAMGDVRWSMSAAEACTVLWPLVRRQAGLPDTEDAPSAWRAALDRLMDKPRPEPSWGGPRGEASSAYADDTHSGGWAVACVIKSLRRIALARERATLHADPLKCKVLTALADRPDLDALLEPLRGGNARHWEVVTRLRVLGVTLSDPTDRAGLELAIRETLRVRVIAPTDRLQVWGLHCTPDVWSEVDDAFARFCSALCPLDLRDRFSTSPALRAELSLPQESGGLGIPRVALEGPGSALQTSGTTATPSKLARSPRTSGRRTAATTRSTRASGSRSARRPTSRPPRRPSPRVSQRRTGATWRGVSSATRPLCPLGLQRSAVGGGAHS